MKIDFISQFIDEQKLPQSYITTIEEHFIPLANELNENYQQQSPKKPYFVGINGCQGSGKSTLTEFLALYLETKFSLNVVVLSLDDFYLNQEKRNLLAQEKHLLFKTRGVPGTHDTKLMASVFNQLRNNKDVVTLPRFNKAIDNPFPQESWPKAHPKHDIVIMEGWCWGVESQKEQALEKPINDLEERYDQLKLWRSTVNNYLKNDYQPLYKFIDYWIMLKAPSFDCVLGWRLEQERKLAQKTDNALNLSIMSSTEIYNFIQYYQRLTEHSLTSLIHRCDKAFLLDTNRKIISN